MNLRTFFSILFGFLVVSVLALALLQNLELLEQPFVLTPENSLPVYAVFVLVFLAGLSVALIISLLQDSHSLFGRVQGWWGARTRRAMEERYRRGIETMLGGHDERAVQIFSDILNRRPDHFEALLLSGDALRNLRRFDDAIERHRRARRLRPDDLRSLYSLANDYEESGQSEKARLALSKIVQLDPSKSLSAFRRLRKIQMKDGNWTASLQTQERIESLIEKTPYKMEAERRYKLGIRYQIAVDLADHNKHKEAIQQFRKVLKAAPNFSPAQLRLGQSQKQIGDEEEAIATWRRGFLETGAPIFLTALQNHFLEQEDPQIAIDTFRSLIADASSPVMPRFFLGRLYLRLEMIDEAYREFDRLQGQVSHSPALHYYLGKTLARRNDYAGSAAEFERALDQVDLPQHQYQCAVCSTRHRRWMDRCETCGEWNTVEIDLREASSLEEMGLSPTPVYSA